MPMLSCPSCNRTLAYPDHVLDGKDTGCPLCGARFNVTPTGQTVAKPRVTPAPGMPAAPTGAAPIRVMCPTCTVQVSVSADRAGQKVRCTNCNQKLLVPNPPKPTKPVPTDKTILAPMVDQEPDAPVLLTIDLDTKSAPMGVPLHRSGVGMGPPPLPTRQLDASPFAGLDQASNDEDDSDDEAHDAARASKGDPAPHSGLGIASFLIALLVGGLDVILAFVIVLGMARSRGRLDLEVNVLAGGTSLVCLNCMSVPLCIVGAGLGIVGLVAHRKHNHLFTWIGLLGNAVVILGVMGLYLLGTVMDAARH